jgi:hypothetical protein
MDSTVNWWWTDLSTWRFNQLKLLLLLLNFESSIETYLIWKKFNDYLFINDKNKIRRMNAIFWNEKSSSI